MAILSKMLSDWRHKMIAPYVKGRVLDIGCGNALMLQKHHKNIDHYVGVEFSSVRVTKLAERFPDADFINRDLDHDLLNIDGHFDSILLIAVIEHIWNQKFLFEQIIDLLAPGGKIIITTPTPFGNDAIHPLGAVMGIFAQSAVDDHIVIYNRRRFRNLAREFNLRLLKYARFQFFSNQLAVFEKKGA